MTEPHSKSSESTDNWTIKPDIEIARSVTPQPILLLAQQHLGLPPESLIPFGHYKAKVDLEQINTHNDANYGKLVLVTAVTPTPAGEGKTTTSVGLNAALNRLGHKSTVCLREPSLGPCFGMKGGAAGGGGGAPPPEKMCCYQNIYLRERSESAGQAARLKASAAER